MWNKPWKLAEGFVISSGLVIAGLLLQLTAGPVHWDLFQFPLNLIALLILLALLVLGYVLRDKVYFFRFSMTNAAAVPAIIFAVGMTALMGFIRQESSPHDVLGFRHMLTSWPFVLIYIWMAWILGMTFIHQVHHFSWRKLPAVVSHLGLFLVLVCGTLGSADMQRLKMYCEVDKPEWRALDENNTTRELPLAVELNQFVLDEYPPKLVLADKEGNTLKENGHAVTLLIDEAFQSGQLGGWTMRVTKRVENALPAMDEDTTDYVESPMPGATCALHVEAVKEDVTRTGWVTCDSYALPSQMLRLDDQWSVAMPQREPQRYASQVHVYTKSGKNITSTIEVNKPLTVEGWKIYQYSYDEQKGRWSQYSVLELVRDPWMPIVYVGIGLLLIGAVGMFVIAQRKKEDAV